MAEWVNVLYRFGEILCSYKTVESQNKGHPFVQMHGAGEFKINAKQTNRISAINSTINLCMRFSSLPEIQQPI